MAETEYLDTSAAAQLTGISKSTLEKWRLHGGGIPFIKAGRLIKYSRADIFDWMAARRRESTSSRHPRNGWGATSDD
jgi:excisionase family DNA binding protein